MAEKRVDFESVLKLGSTLPGVERFTSYGSPALRVNGKLMARLPTHKSAEPDSLVVRVDFERRAELLAGAPEIYYVTDHYADYPYVLVRMSRLHPDSLRDLLGMAWRCATRKPDKPRRPRGQGVSTRRCTK
jgi:hypothetical protein